MIDAFDVYQRNAIAFENAPKLSLKRACILIHSHLGHTLIGMRT
ncbi:hypothetical protein ABIG04_005395 [Bradyrhizobium japonicum]